MRISWQAQHPRVGRIPSPIVVRPARVVPCAATKWVLLPTRAQSPVCLDRRRDQRLDASVRRTGRRVLEIHMAHAIFTENESRQIDAVSAEADACAPGTFETVLVGVGGTSTGRDAI